MRHPRAFYRCRTWVLDELERSSPVSYYDLAAESYTNGIGRETLDYTLDYLAARGAIRRHEGWASGFEDTGHLIHKGGPIRRASDLTRRDHGRTRTDKRVTKPGIAPAQIH